MKDMQFLYAFADRKIQANPEYKEDILDFVKVAADGVEEGNDTDHEVELAIANINELFKYFD